MISISKSVEIIRLLVACVCITRCSSERTGPVIVVAESVRERIRGRHGVRGERRVKHRVVCGCCTLTRPQVVKVVPGRAGLRSRSERIACETRHSRLLWDMVERGERILIEAAARAQVGRDGCGGRSGERIDQGAETAGERRRGGVVVYGRRGALYFHYFVFERIVVIYLLMGVKFNGLVF